MTNDRSMRIADIRERVQTDRYEIDAHDIASAMLRRPGVLRLLLGEGHRDDPGTGAQPRCA